MKKITLKGGAGLYVTRSDKFKTWSLSIHLYRPLSVKEASQSALLAAVLKTSCEKYPTRTEMIKKRDLMYGTVHSVTAMKSSDIQVLSFTIKAVCDKYLPENITEDAIDFLKQIIFHPFVEDGKFDEKIVELEKNNIIKEIESYVNDKGLYADKQCLTAMCEGEPFAVDSNGSIEELKSITPESLYGYYIEVLKDSKKNLFVSGDVDAEKVEKAFESLESKADYPKISTGNMPEKVRVISEKMDVTQGKLVLGYRFEDVRQEMKPTAMVFNAVFGGSAVSKLFNNVREKLSLAYYAASRLYFSKGIVFVKSGIEISKYDETCREIGVQLGEIVCGNITDEELSNAAAHLINIYSSLDDDPVSAAVLKSGNIASGDERTVEELIEQIKQVTKEDIVNFAKGVKLDTVYFLTGEGEQNE